MTPGPAADDSIRRCVGCDAGVGMGHVVSFGVGDECRSCRWARVRPLLDHLEGRTAGEQEAFVRGILWAKCKEGDLDAIRELGGVLDELRSERAR